MDGFNDPESKFQDFADKMTIDTSYVQEIPYTDINEFMKKIRTERLRNLGDKKLLQALKK